MWISKRSIKVKNLTPIWPFLSKFGFNLPLQAVLRFKALDFCLSTKRMRQRVHPNYITKRMQPGLHFPLPGNAYVLQKHGYMNKSWGPCFIFSHAYQLVSFFDNTIAIQESYLFIFWFYDRAQWLLII